MNKEYDVIEMDFPEYEEEYPPFPDVKSDVNFAVCKDEIYARNIELAKKMPLVSRNEKDKEKAVSKKAEKAKPKKSKRSKAEKIIVSAAAVLAAAAVSVTAAVFAASDIQKPEKVESKLIINSDQLESVTLEQHFKDAELYYDSDGNKRYAITIGFTIKNTADAPVIFYPMEHIWTTTRGKCP